MLSCYTVLDFTDERGELGPMLLADLGARVIRVETPSGSDARRAGPFVSGAQEEGLGSLQFIAFNRSKESIVLDPEDREDQKTLHKLLGRADFVIESARLMQDWFGLTREDARAVNPNLVHVRVTGFGDAGPHSAFLANDLVLAAMGGPMSLQGRMGRPPLKLTVPQVWRHAGAEAAVAAMLGHHNRLRTGKGQFADLSAQSAMTWTMLNSMDAEAIQGHDFNRVDSVLVTREGPKQLVHPTRDGHLVAVPIARVLEGLTEPLIEAGLADESYRHINWPDFDLNGWQADYRPLNQEQATRLMRKFFARHDKQYLFELGLRLGISLAPVNRLSELLAMEHLKARDYWRDLALQGKSICRPGIWVKPLTGDLGIGIRGKAPALGEHSSAIRAELKEKAPARELPEPDGELPFAGLRVADFTWVGVGPISTRFLADHGAEVVRIESSLRPDVLRGATPFKDGVPGINRSQFYGDFNTSKRSISLDMKSEEAIQLAKQIIARSDVVIESFAPGAMARMGLSHDEIRRINPKVIMVSTCLMGQTGPASSLAGYGYHAASLAGFYEVTGWPDEPPSSPWIAYTDTIAPRFISCLLAAALDHRRRTGEGCCLDVAQIETALHFLAPELMDLQLNGFEASRNGNRNRFAAPQGAYPCAGEDRFIAIAVETDQQWQLLCDVMEKPQLAEDTRLQNTEARLAQHDELDRVIADWTSGQEAYPLMQTLQAAGIPAGVVQRSSDLLRDPQYQHRRFYRYYEHQEMGRIPYAGHQYLMEGYDNGPRWAAPCLGQHSYEVLSELLKLSDEEVAAAYACGAIS